MTKDKSKQVVSRAHFVVVDLDDDDYIEYWKSRSIEERLAHIEYLRELNYGYSSEQRLQRFFEVVEFPQS